VIDLINLINQIDSIKAMLYISLCSPCWRQPSFFIVISSHQNGLCL